MPQRSGPTPTFDTLLVDAGNRVAAAAGRRAAEAPGSSYNPLFIFGPPGVGKSHLLSAIEQRAREVDPEICIHREGLDSVLDRAAQSVSSGRLGRFRESFTGLDLLILDDLHRASGQVRVQAELTRVVEEMVQRGAQVVVAAEEPPQEIAEFDAQLAARLASGLVVDVAPAEESTRLAIARGFLRERRGELGEELLKALAATAIRSAHELRGAVHRLVAEAELGGPGLTPADLPRLLNLESGDAGAPGDEFGAFLSDISTAVAAVVETSPWRRRLARAILGWEGEGYRTRRLEEALDADEPPDVESLLDRFERDVSRLRQIARALPRAPGDPALLRDPDRLAEAEALLEATAAGQSEQQPAAPRPGRNPARVDDWYRDAEKVAWGWLGLDDRIMEEKG
jgi:chromosomal replication initiator protein